MNSIATIIGNKLRTVKNSVMITIYTEAVNDAAATVIDNVRNKFYTIFKTAERWV